MHPSYLVPTVRACGGRDLMEIFKFMNPNIQAVLKAKMDPKARQGVPNEVALEYTY